MKRNIAIALIIAGCILVFAGAGYYMLSRWIENPGPEVIPDRLVGHQLGAKVTGSQAVSEINQMHGKEFPLTSGSVGVYGERRQATLWVSGAPGRWMAKRILFQMRDKIAEENSPFTSLGARDIDGRVVYELEGLGQKHYYFQSGDLIVWLAVNAGEAELALVESLAFYP